MQNPFRCARSADPKQLIETVFRQAALAAQRAKVEGRVSEKAVQKEGVRLKTVGNALTNELKAVANSWPNFSKIPQIYKELAEVLGGVERLKKAIGFVNWTANQIKNLQMSGLKRLKYSRTTFDARDVRQHFYGRAASYVKRCKRELMFLTEVSKLLRNLPDFEDAPTIVIAGLPNVGKSSLLKAITGSAPKIAPWQFTTKGLMLGHVEFNFHSVQFIDTPGLLDRPAAKRNIIEQQAITVLKVLADLIIYVFDPSETCGYSLEQQLRLYKEIKQTFKRPIIAVANKSDIIGAKPVEEIKVSTISVSCETGAGIEALKKVIKAQLKSIKHG
ncbi:MAG: GTPase [Candidatus Aenigmatarchaeota archaeon]